MSPARQSGTTPAVEPKPRDDELDAAGLTDVGKVRKENQDHFLFGTLHKTIRVRTTSLAAPEALQTLSERLASVTMVADGVGGGEGGEAASRTTIETLTAYVNHTMQCYYRANHGDDDAFLEELQAAARTCHDTVTARAREIGLDKMATTLTLGLAVWPRLFLLQVGDSRCYVLREGELVQLSRDQTMAQALVDSGVIKPSDIERSPFRNVLSSAIGRGAAPEVSQHHISRGDILLFCTDGLTKHVSDEQIRQRLLAMRSSQEGCRQLVDDALAGGGSDNVTVLIVRVVDSPIHR
jgi:protein phosphatase